MAAVPAVTADWWRDAAIYQVASRSFADGDGDGTGRPGGRPHRLCRTSPNSASTPCGSPLVPLPAGRRRHDVADYRTIDPAFGTTAERGREADLRAADLGIRVIIVIVPTTSPTSTPGSGPR